MTHGRVVPVSADAGHEPPSLARGKALVTVVVAALVFVVLAAVLVPWDWVPGGQLSPAAAGDVFTPAEISRAEDFSASQRMLGWSSYFVSLALALGLGLTPWGARLVGQVTGRMRRWTAVPLGVTVLVCVGALATLPFSIASHDLGTDYGLSNQPWDEWAVDYVKSLMVSCVMMSLVVMLVVGTARRSPRHWFAWAGVLAAVVTFAASFLYPVVVEPLFNQFTPMKAGAFKSSVFALARTEGVRIDDVLVSDASRRTTTLNAYVSGFGGTRRVVVYDNLLRDLTPDQARVVIAHELGHAKHKDVLLGTVLGSVGGVAGIALLAVVLDSRRLRRLAGVSGAADPKAVALLLALVAVGAFVASPVQNTISRAVEARADRDSIRVTRQGDVFKGMQHELSVRSLSDPTPPALSQFWFGSHPTVLQRVGLPTSLRRTAQ